MDWTSKSSKCDNLKKVVTDIFRVYTIDFFYTVERYIKGQKFKTDVNDIRGLWRNLTY